MPLIIDECDMMSRPIRDSVAGPAGAGTQSRRKQLRTRFMAHNEPGPPALAKKIHSARIYVGLICGYRRYLGGPRRF